MRDPDHEANRVAALTASHDRRRAGVTASIERRALELFREHGIDGVTVDDIACAAGISRRTFYRYFESPIEIVRIVIGRSLDGWAGQVRSRPLSEPILASFRAADAFALSSADNAESLRLALAVMGRSPAAWARISGPMQAQTTHTYQQIIAERLAARGRDPATSGAIAAGLTAIMVHLAEKASREQRTLVPNEFEAALNAFALILADPDAGSSAG